MVNLRPVASGGALTNEAKAFLVARGIGRKTWDRLGLISGRKYFRKLKREAPAIGFPYLKDGRTYAVKWRCIEAKDFLQDGSATTFYRIEEAVPDKPIIIVEGELDDAAMVEAGIENVISVPNGAPQKVNEGRVDPSLDRKFSYVWEAKEFWEECQKVIVFTDGDEPGQALGEELARRIGKHKCWMVRRPDDCKDAGEILKKYGRDRLGLLIEKAEPWPVAGLYAATHYTDQVLSLYEKGHGRGESTGLPAIDELFTIVPGQMTVVTGIPSCGKSEFVDQIMANLAEAREWKFAICSFENPPQTHIAKLIEKRARQPFHKGPTSRLTRADLNTSLDWVNEHFCFIDQSDGEPSTIESILDRASAAVQRMGVRGLVIDPYNYIDLPLNAGTETSLISGMLTKVRNFAKAHEVHVWFVAHPAKLMREGNRHPIPRGYDISGSAAWFAKSDIGFTVDRPVDDTGVPIPGDVEIHVWKVRFKWIGKQGVARLAYDTVTGRYSEPYDWRKAQAVFKDPWDN